MSRLIFVSSALLFSAAAMSCSGDDGSSSGTDAQVCTPGKTESCPCPGGAQGSQACNADGSGYDTCMCPDDSSTASATEGTSVGTSASTTSASTTSASTTDATATDSATTDATATGTTTGATTTGATTGTPGAKWLQNDGFNSGDNVGLQGGFANGECWGSVYVADAGDYPFEVTGVEMLVGGSTEMQPFNLEFWDVDGNNMPSNKVSEAAIGITGADDAVSQADFDTIMLAKPVIMTGNFALVVCHTAHAGYPSIARDDDGNITADRNWIMAQGVGWVQSSLLGLTGDWIMRARIEPM